MAGSLRNGQLLELLAVPEPRASRWLWPLLDTNHTPGATAMNSSGSWEFRDLVQTGLGVNRLGLVEMA